MSVFKTTFSRALSVIKSDSVNIPYPSPIISSSTTSSAGSTLIDTTVNFISLSVKPGDIVYNNSDSVSAVVLEVINSTTLLLSVDITYSIMNYTIYVASSQSGLGNTGCFLYVGRVGNVSVVTIGGDEVIFNNVPSGATLPIQVIKVKSTGTTAINLIALW